MNKLFENNMFLQRVHENLPEYGLSPSQKDNGRNWWFNWVGQISLMEVTTEQKKPLYKISSFTSYPEITRKQIWVDTFGKAIGQFKKEIDELEQYAKDNPEPTGYLIDIDHEE